MKSHKLILGLLLNLFRAFSVSAQNDNTVHEDSGVFISNRESGAALKINSSQEKSMRWQISLSCAWNGIGINNKLAQSADNSLGVIKHEDYPNIKGSIDYYGRKKWGAGASFSEFNEVLSSSRVVGSIDHPGSLWLFFYLPGYTETFEDNITISNSAKIISVYANYKVIEYSDEKQQPFEITLRQGFSVSSISENRSMTASILKDSVNAQGNSYIYTKSTYFHDSLEKTALSIFLGGQVLIHYRKHLSIILADVKENVGLVNPSVPESTITVDNTKNLNI